MDQKTKILVFMAILIALMLLFSFTPIGYIPLGFVDITLMCLPVLIGTFVLGLRSGLGLAAVFIATSLIQLVIKPSALTLLMLDSNVFLCILNLIIPRIFIPLVCWGIWRALKNRWPRLSMVIASAGGSLANTFGYLLLLQIWFFGAVQANYSFTPEAAQAFIWGIALTNGVPEAIAAAVICPPVSHAVTKSIGPIRRSRKEKSTL